MQISLAGRIVAVADSYEVMTAVRPYRKPIGRVGGSPGAGQVLRSAVRPGRGPRIPEHLHGAPLASRRTWFVDRAAALDRVGRSARMELGSGDHVRDDRAQPVRAGNAAQPGAAPHAELGHIGRLNRHRPGQTGGSGPAAAGSGSTTGGATSGQTTSTTPAPAPGSGGGSGADGSTGSRSDRHAGTGQSAAFHATDRHADSRPDADSVVNTDAGPDRRHRRHLQHPHPHRPPRRTFPRR